MRTFLLEYGLYVEWVLAFAEFILMLILFSDYNKKHAPIILWMGILGLGLVVDAIIIAVGAKVIEPVLMVFSRIRFTMHGLMLPLVLTICAMAIPLRPIPRWCVYGLTPILMALGGMAGWSRELALQDTIGDVVRFASVSPKDSWMEIVTSVIAYGTIIVLIVTGIYMLLRERSSSILLGGVLMFTFAALGPATGSFDLIFLISMFGELFLLLFFVVFEKRHVEEE
ncbi:MAG: hypothetical protein K5695_05025 [Oscillospiraceae bacterium]|nr:hypothetical protein [Oscillospiraceae bacterium]